MGNNRFDTMQVSVGCGFRIGQHKFAVENIQAFIFHRAHIEMANRNDLEQIKVIFKTINLFIPAH